MARSRVSIVKCDDYSPVEVKEALKKALDLIGGIDRFVKPGSKVLLKPNLLSAKTPDKAVTTHPELVRAVARLVKEAGGLPSIGDSPGSFFTVKAIDDVFEKTGMKKIADEEGCSLVKFDKIEHIEGYPVATAFKEYDLVINLPKMKTHTLALLTGAVKNTFGFMAGLNKVQCHKSAPNINDFTVIINDIYSITRPGLSIMDGIVGMDKDGPAAGRVRKCNVILASSDAVSLDAIFSHIVGLPYQKNLVVKNATERGLGNGRLKDIEVSGQSLESSKIKDFILPKTALPYRFPSWLTRPLTELIGFKPFIDEGLCKKCNICVQSCPVDAITINKDISLIDKEKCVKCFCCHEVCPYNAINIRKNLLAKLIWSR